MLLVRLLTISTPRYQQRRENEVKRKPCIGIFGANDYTYKLQDNYLIFQSGTTDNATRVTKVNTTIFYLDNNSDLMVYDFISQPNKADDLTMYRFERQK